MRSAITVLAGRKLLSFFNFTGGANAAVTAGEFFNAARGINKFLLSSEKWVARGTDADLHVATGRARAIRSSASADDNRFLVIGMNFRFHFGGLGNVMGGDGGSK